MQISKAVVLPFLVKEILAIPPMFKQDSDSGNKSLSPIGTNGAPCPFNATSKLLKSQTVSTPVFAAIVAVGTPLLGEHRKG